MSSPKPFLTLSLNTFVRYYAMDTSKLVAEVYRRMQQAGGYDFYRILNEAIRAKIKRRSDDEILSILNSSSNVNEVSHNRAAYEVFVEKFGKKKGLSEFEKKGQVKLADGQLQILVAPTFSVENASGLTVYHVWATQSIAIDRAIAGVSVHLMQRAFQKTAPNYEYKLFDAVEGKQYSTVNNTTQQAVEICARNIIDLARSS